MQPSIQDEVRTETARLTGRTPELNKALAAVQAEIPKFSMEDQRNVIVEHKDGTSHDYNYVTLGRVIEVTAPILAKHGLSFRALPGYGDPGDGKISMVLRYTLAHASGEQVDGIFPISAGDKGIQGLGSAITYARRYCLAALLNIAVEQDDDGMVAMLDGDQQQGVRAQARGTTRRRAPATRSNQAAERRPTSSAAAALPGGDPVTGEGDVPPKKMMDAMFATLNDWKGQQSREERLALVSEIVGRPITTSNDMSRAEVAKILDTANHELGRDAVQPQEGSGQ